MTFEVPINRIRVDALLPTLLGSGTLIEWEISDKYCSRDLEFAVLYGRSPTDTFQKLGTTQDTYFIDTEERRGGVDTEVYYAIVSRDDETDETWSSQPQRAGSNWGKQQWRLAREIVRQERVRLTKGAAPGVRGYLCKRRNYGEQCSECTDEHTGKVIDPDCGTCYGTGIVGGYYPPVEVFVDQNPDKVVRKLTQDQGMLKDSISSWRVLAYPRFETNDFFVDASQNLRYKIQPQVQTVGHISGIPIVQQVEVKLEERHSPIYEFPVTDNG